MTAKPSIRIVDDPSVREIVATSTVTGSLTEGLLFVTLAASRALPEATGLPPSQGPVAQVTGRLVLTPSAAVEMVNTLSSLLSTIPGINVARR
ncbi:hypothetical protein [Methylobacterium sp. WL7]|uniref:hypothetical protein n=1 Tax=Methylobacterium sp. WL7 TaxID=2603900 RepID=UPI0011CA3A9B|nr:hypothetical protein [Methylobacterium sp. WL7]TXN43876.1 hypothetical protein FV233_16880 [Methylobacterium sp. WL7]